MKTNNLTLLLVSTFLVSTTASAMQEKLSDAFNGIGVPKEERETHIMQMKLKFHEKADKKGSLFEQVNRYFAPVTRKGTDHDRLIANSILDVLESDFEKAKFKQQMYDSCKEDGLIPSFTKETLSMQGLPSQSGYHIAMVRELSALSKKLEDLTGPFEKRSGEKAQLTLQHQENEKALPDLEHKAYQLGRQKATLLKLQEEYINQINSLNEKIEFIKNQTEEINSQSSKNKQDKEESLSSPHEGLKEKLDEVETLKNEKKGIEVELASLSQNDVNKEKSENPGSASLTEDLEAQKQSEFLKERLKTIESEITPLNSAIDLLKTQMKDIENKHTEVENGFLTQIKNLEMSQGEFSNSLDTLKNTLTKEVDEPFSVLEIQIQENLEKTQKIQKEMEETHTILASFDKTSLLLKEEINQKKQELRNLQDKADLYALIKYFKYLNLYLALPNDDFDHTDSERLQTLSYYDLPMMRKITNNRAAEVGRHNVENAVPREILKYGAAVLQGMAAFDYDPIMRNELDQANHGFTYAADRKRFSLAFNNHLKKKLTTDIFNTIYEKDKNRFDYSPHPITEEEFIEEIKVLDPLRADRLLKEAALKWKDKISLNDNSFIHRLGFSPILFHKDFDFQQVPTLFSLKIVYDSLPSELVRTADKVDWKFASVQLKTNFSQSWVDKQSPIHERITPIFAFVNDKASKAAQKKKSKEQKETYIEESFLKMMSYMNMYYALTHDIKGTQTEPLHLIDPALEPYLKDSISPAQRLDYVMANKALKWADRIWTHGQDFIEKLGLKAWFFDAYITAENKDKS